MKYLKNLGDSDSATMLKVHASFDWISCLLNEICKAAHFSICPDQGKEKIDCHNICILFTQWIQGSCGPCFFFPIQLTCLDKVVSLTDIQENSNTFGEVEEKNKRGQFCKKLGLRRGKVLFPKLSLLSRPFCVHSKKHSLYIMEKRLSPLNPTFYKFALYPESLIKNYCSSPSSKAITSENSDTIHWNRYSGKNCRKKTSMDL